MLMAVAYGIEWFGSTIESLIEQIDAYGEANNLRAVSIVAKEV